MSTETASEAKTYIAIIGLLCASGFFLVQGMCSVDSSLEKARQGQVREWTFPEVLKPRLPDLNYARDPKTGLCFAWGTEVGTQPRRGYGYLTQVPCAPVVKAGLLKPVVK